MNSLKKIACLTLPALLGACASLPSGPSVMSLPGNGKNFEQFRADDQACRQHANVSLDGGSVAQAQTDSVVKSAAVGTAIGAVAGAALGGRGGAASGAGIGLLFGSAGGASAANASGQSAQRRYDNAYVQCMYAKGNQVPMASALPVRSRYYSAVQPSMVAMPPPGVDAQIPPPPAGMPPPPPAGVPPPPPPGVTVRP